MERNIFLEFIVIIVAFFSVWFLLSRIEFIAEGDMSKFSKATEKKLAELIIKSFDHDHKDFDDRQIKTYIDSIGRRICAANEIAFDSIKIHIVKEDDVNAFALPDRNMVIYTGLITDAKNAEEVAGVMAHEIGHMEKNHVMEKLAKELGISMLLVLAGGSENFEVLREAGHILSSTAFDRSQESEADAYAVEILAKAEVDPEPFGNFLFRLSTGKNDMPEELVWISTHPNGKDRAAAIFSKKKEYTFTPKPVLQTLWETVQQTISKADQNED